MDDAAITRREVNRKLFTKDLLDQLLTRRPHRQSMIWDTKETGLAVLISRGPKHARQATVTFRVVYYLKDLPGKPRYKKLGRYPSERSDIWAVRDEARAVRVAAQQGNDPRRPRPTGKFSETVAKFIEEHAEQNRTAAETKRIFDVYVTPEWADRNIDDIKKGDVSDLLSRIARGKIEHQGKKVGTPAVARATRAQLVTLFNWWDANYGSKAFRHPVPKLMKSSPLKPAGERERDLEDHELRALWSATGELGAYGAAVRTALLTAQRFRKVGVMRRSDLKQHQRVQGEDIGNLWDPSREDDPKNKKVSPVPLSRLAHEIIAAVPLINADHRHYQDFVFTTTGTGPIKGWSKYKARLDRKMLEVMRQEAEAEGRDPQQVELKPWQHRDVRRTTRTLMARIGVSREVAEHCLGHVLSRIERTYNRYRYLPEKREAFEKMAEHVQRIVNPPAGANVVPLRR
jgi:hypothetical protein